MFDQAEITVRAGDGGSGAVSFRREKYVPFGGPDGGHGGAGGSVVLVADKDISNLKTYTRRKSFRAESGGPGGRQNKHGRDGADLILTVPPGTLVSSGPPGEGGTVIADLESSGQRMVVAQGGRGGAGNASFATPTNQAPQTAKKGKPGEEKTIKLELRLIADVGIVGFPNVGKSSLLSAVSAARPRIAEYPFTTLQPVLGVVETPAAAFVLAEIPGLIEGAHRGRGLGHEFLRHITRTRVLIHLIDGTSTAPVQDMAAVNGEIASFDPRLADKPQLVAINKIDLPEVKQRQDELRQAFAAAGVKVFFVSAVSGEGIPELVSETLRRLQALPKPPPVAVPKVFRPLPGRPAGGREKGE